MKAIPYVLSNSYKYITDWELLGGVNRVCYVVPYGLRGIRKRDYPSGLITEQPYFDKASYYNSYLSRMGAVMGAVPDDCAGALLVSPLSTAYCRYSGREEGESAVLDAAFGALAERLAKAFIPHHLGAENLLAADGRAEGGRLYVGKCGYKTVILPYMRNITAGALSVLESFSAQGKLICTGGRPELVDGKPAIGILSNASVMDENELLRYLKESDHIPVAVSAEEGDVRMAFRRFGERLAVFILNLSKTSPAAVVLSTKESGCRELDVLGLQFKGVEVDGRSGGARIALYPMQSRLIVIDGEREPLNKGEIVPLKARSGTFTVTSMSENIFVMDKCDCYLEGELYASGEYVIRLFDRLLKERKRGRLRLEFEFFVTVK
jgi:hypothetical protein